MPEIEIELGPEWDYDAVVCLKKVCDQLGFPFSLKYLGHAGSQEIFQGKIKAGDQMLKVQKETYMGLRIQGPAEIVNRIAEEHAKIYTRPSKETA